MANNKSPKNYKMASAAIFTVSLICIFCGVYFVPTIGLIVAFFLFLYAKWMETDEQTNREYNEFVYSMAIRTGMTMEQVKTALNGQPFATDQKVSISESKICPTCGGKVVNGTCQYCGNMYSDDSNFVVLSYSCKYGTKAYTFKNGILEKINTHANPIEDFLILK